MAKQTVYSLIYFQNGNFPTGSAGTGAANQYLIDQYIFKKDVLD
jgi:hypothetical protein